MSVTFSVEGARYTRRAIDCIVCQGTGADQGERCPYCDGTGRDTEDVCEHPELNLANQNARALLNALGEAADPDDELCGRWPASEVALVETRLQVIRAGLVPTLERETVRDGNVLYCGVDCERAQRQIDGLLAVVVAARHAKTGVVWA